MIFFGFNRLFALLSSSQYDYAKTFKTRRYFLITAIMKNYDVIINGNIFNDLKKLENKQQDQAKITLMDVY